MQKQPPQCLKFSDSNRVLIINPNVLKVFEKCEQKGHNSREAGGILLGYVCKHYDEIVKATVPNQLDSRGPSFFKRLKKPAQLRINRSWGKSEGSLIYLGEWHTHCVVNPQPSVIDRKMIKKVFDETKIEIDFLYLIIVGLNQSYWMGTQTRTGLVELDAIK